MFGNENIRLKLLHFLEWQWTNLFSHFFFILPSKSFFHVSFLGYPGRGDYSSDWLELRNEASSLTFYQTGRESSFLAEHHSLNLGQYHCDRTGTDFPVVCRTETSFLVSCRIWRGNLFFRIGKGYPASYQIWRGCPVVCRNGKVHRACLHRRHSRSGLIDRQNLLQPYCRCHLCRGNWWSETTSLLCAGAGCWWLQLCLIPYLQVEKYTGVLYINHRLMNLSCYFWFMVVMVGVQLKANM